MKHVIQNIFSYEKLSPAKILFSGEGGTIVIEFLFNATVRAHYEFDGVPISPRIQEANEYILSGEKSRNVNVTVTDNNVSYSLTYGPVRVTIEKKFGLLAAYYEDVLQHGGSLGTADTVIPDFQVRAFTRGDQKDYSVGRFNFPLDKNDEFYGLGDKGGAPNRAGRNFAMFNRDSLGYDAANSDPLYKSIPFFFKKNDEKGVLCGLMFDQPHITTIDLGRESPFYYSAESTQGPYSYYVFLGKTYKEILFEYYSVTGFPALPPLFSFGFLGSSMNYTEPADAEQRILRFFEQVEEYEIPCEGLYASSGYLKADDGKRYAFIWNKNKFPDHGTFLKKLAKRGYNLCMNIKPGVLVSHPWYEDLVSKGYFIKDSDGKPYQEFFWGGDASLVDFTNPEACNWWKEQLKEVYLTHGNTGIWNDNNEFELEDFALDHYPIRSTMPVRMAQASYEAYRECYPDRRPWIYSRSGFFGIQKYARTWTGDNVSDWQTLRYNQYMGFSMGLSGLPYFGHDLGGFFGDFPEPELLLRSCQSAVFQARFVIHSWRENGIPTEPWSYPELLEPIKNLIQEHYRFLPYTYNVAIQTHQYGYPMERYLKLEYPQDSNISEMECNSLFGDSILKVAVVDKGVTTQDVYLPDGDDWYSGNTGEFHAGGTTVAVPCPCDGSHQWFAKSGSVIPTTTDRDLSKGLFSEIDFLVYPSSNSASKTVFYEDDGSTIFEHGRYNRWEISIENETITITVTERGMKTSPAKNRRFTLMMPPMFSLLGDASFNPETQDSFSVRFHKV